MDVYAECQRLLIRAGGFGNFYNDAAAEGGGGDVMWLLSRGELEGDVLPLVHIA